MTRTRAELRAFAQTVIEICAPTIVYRWWPPSILIDQQAADERVAAVRAGRRRIGVETQRTWFDDLINDLRARRRRGRRPN